jgi:CRP/FNR family transcriptional regulator, cyclic AMP receptor protein
MQDNSEHDNDSNQKQSKREKKPEERADFSVSPAEGIVVERWGNPGVLDLVRNDPSIVVEEGAVLFKEGDPADCMYIVRTGTLRIRSGSVVYEDAIAGGIVGEMAIVEDSVPRSAMVYALTRSELVKIDETRFFSLVAETPSFARTVMRVLSRRLRRMNLLYRPDRWTEWP